LHVGVWVGNPSDSRFSAIDSETVRGSLRQSIYFPVDHGKQDHFIGAAITPECFGSLPYKERAWDFSTNHTPVFHSPN
jgi:hypothetical protein